MSYYLLTCPPSHKASDGLSGYGLVVEQLVANQLAGVRFSLPAHLVVSDFS